MNAEGNQARDFAHVAVTYPVSVAVQGLCGIVWLVATPVAATIDCCIDKDDQSNNSCTTATSYALIFL